MIGLIIVAIFAGYIILSIAVISVVYMKTKNIKKMFIALAIMILIPTWDVILGYPIYKFLCWSNAGVKIYKTVDNVEGFYVGEKEQRHEPHELYDGYKYLDYKEIINNKPTGKYYRSYWLDSNSSKECIKPRYPDSPYDEYTKAFKSGKCIVKEEIAENEISRWDTSWDSKTEQIENYHPIEIYGLGITLEKVGQIRDRTSGDILSEHYLARWREGWLVRLLTYLVGPNTSVSCGIDYSNLFEQEYKTLKPKKQEEK